MAPIVVDGLNPTIFPSWPIISWFAISVVVAIWFVVSCSLLLIVVMCACSKGAKKGAEYVSFDFRSPYFCEECAMRAWQSFYPNDPNPMLDPGWEENKKTLIPKRADDFDTRLHYFNHGSGSMFREPTPAATMRMKEEYQSVMQQNRSVMSTRPPTPRGSASEYGGGRGGGGGAFGGGGGGGGPTGFKSARNPAYGTLYDAKSNVFERGGGGGKRPAASCAIPRGSPRAGGAQTVMHGEAQMRAAQANPAYQTIWAAKSGVFDKPGGGGGGGGGMSRPPQGGGGAANETRMAAAAKNPAYQTLYDAKTGVFDKGGGGGGGGRRGGGAMPATSNYRD